MLLFAVWLPAILVLVGLVYSIGLILVERRAVQTAADAASTAATWTLVYELESGDRRDSKVLQQVQTYAAQATGGSASAVYTDAQGNLFSPSVSVGSGSTFPSAARGIRVSVQKRVPTVLDSLIRTGGVLTAATGTAALVPTAPPNPAAPLLPVAVNLNDFQLAMSTGGTYNLLAPTTLPPGASTPLLDFAHSPAAAFAPGGQPQDSGYSRTPPVSDDATGPSSIFTNLQYWSDGWHSPAAAVVVGASVGLVSATPIPDSAFVDAAYTSQQVDAYTDAFVAGLLDNLGRQGRTDAGGNPYGLMLVPLWDTSPSPGTLHVVGGALIRLRLADIAASSASGQFVLYPAAAWGMPQQPVSIDVGARLVRLIS
jgi:Putative Flp pilus-assembly TadE/G-like